MFSPNSFSLTVKQNNNKIRKGHDSIGQRLKWVAHWSHSSGAFFFIIWLFPNFDFVLIDRDNFWFQLCWLWITFQSFFLLKILGSTLLCFHVSWYFVENCVHNISTWNGACLILKEYFKTMSSKWQIFAYQKESSGGLKDYIHPARVKYQAFIKFCSLPKFLTYVPTVIMMFFPFSIKTFESFSWDSE